MSGIPDPMRVFDRPLHRKRRDRAAATVHRVAPVLEAAAELLLDRLDDTTHRFSRALDLGGRGVVVPRLRARGIPFVVSMDLSAGMAARAGGLPLAGDEEWLPFAPESFDLVVASLSLHWVNDLPGALVQIRRALRPDGLLLASLPGLGTLHSLREALAGAETELRGGLSPRVSPFPDLRDLAGLLQRAGFAMPVADAETLNLSYRSPMALFADLRAAGEGNAVLARDGRIPPRALLPLAASRLPELDGAIPVELRLLTMTGWAPHESQSRPARPGSATHRLADALGVEERSAGEKAGTQH
ncbi:methyltransferase domain-containing protein [Siccirubricoccus sp. KC 17139]|uniref:Methyltransferase domain-containing protein n=1 Tax=Siccirubricoccus soli TaxID=2899147 RepID=A0ABT1D218_9PROT|nr:methyltransferase domain-containing protein [Siccirubricoccus soli]MCO6415972.1 methyltransferase domain-containing protein [Siccirubricoccus soli]MCP2682104.1 methyltransferase domain-containing protein [Siccirubricoccus soli]